MTLTEFLLARIADDEAKAKAAIGCEYHITTTWDNAYVVHHVDNWSSERVLAECEAKRHLADLHQPRPGHRWPNRWEPEYPNKIFVKNVCAACYQWSEEDDCAENTDYPCRTTLILALPYADHPDYRQEWKP